MIILEGPNQDLRARLGPLLRERMPEENPSVHLSADDFRPSLKRLVALAHADHRWQIRNGLWLEHIDTDARHMIAYALLAAGSMVVVCDVDATMTVAQAENHTPFPGVLALYYVCPGYNLEEEADKIAQRWRDLISEADRFWMYASNGHTTRSPIMLVGDRVNPFVPAELNKRRMAFISHHGSSLYLHDAMRRAKGRYYVTNAVKYTKKQPNLQTLKEEIEKVKPGRIVALGSEAAEVLAKVSANFTTTYHPQYWKRFHAERLSELVDCLRP